MPKRAKTPTRKPRTPARKAPERLIFEYYDGTEYRRADPMAIVFAFLRHKSFNIESDPKAAAEGDVEAIQRSIEATREAFSLQPFDEGGLNDMEALQLMTRFGEYITELKKKSSR